jgi:hypothetical protein
MLDAWIYCIVCSALLRGTQMFRILHYTPSSGLKGSGGIYFTYRLACVYLPFSPEDGHMLWSKHCGIIGRSVSRYCGLSLVTQSCVEYREVKCLEHLN